MIIAVNTHSLFPTYSSAFKKAFVNAMYELADLYPDHSFVFISNIFSGRAATKNSKTITITAKANGPVRWKLWYDYTLPATLKKVKANVLISMEAVSLKTNTPQVLVMPGLSFLNAPQFYKESQLRFYKKQLPAFLDKATNAIASTDFLKDELIKKYSVAESKIAVMPLFNFKEYRALHWKDADLIKEKYAEGMEYFLYAGEISEEANLVNLLKAFSRFKKMQKSSMQLILAGDIAEGYISFAESLKTYKYRNEVKLLQHLPDEERIKIMASAYTFIDVSLNMDNNIAALQAIRCEVPVIISKNEAMQAVFGEAALYTNPIVIEDIADKLMFVFKDEDSRNVLIEEGKQLQARSSGKMVDFLWKAIVAATKQ